MDRYQDWQVAYAADKARGQPLRFRRRTLRQALLKALAGLDSAMLADQQVLRTGGLRRSSKA